MKIDLTEAMVADHYDWHTQVPFEMKTISFVQGNFSVEEESLIEVDIHHEKDGQLQVRGTAQIQVTIPCDRCLTPVSYKFSVEAERELDLSEEEQPAFLEGKLLDIDGLVFHELLLHWPAKILCREDCKGICTVCGTDLNQGECGCDRQVLDPRMAAIQDIFNKFQS